MFLTKISHSFTTFWTSLFSKNNNVDTCKRPPNNHNLDYIACPYEGFSVVQKGDKAGFVDLSGNLIIPLIYDAARSFSDGLAEVKINEQTFFIDPQGNTVIQIPNTIEVISEFKEGLLGVKQNNKIGFMDKKGNIAINFQYDNASNFREGLAVVAINHKQGFIDKVGKLVIPFKYDETQKFFNGIANVRIGNKWGSINQQGELIIPMIYDFIGNFNDSEIADAQLNGHWIKIDKKGNPIQTELKPQEFNTSIRHKKILNILNKK